MIDIILAWFVIEDIKSGRNTGKLIGYVVVGLMIAFLLTIVAINL